MRVNTEDPDTSPVRHALESYLNSARPGEVTGISKEDLEILQSYIHAYGTVEDLADALVDQYGPDCMRLCNLTIPEATLNMFSGGKVLKAKLAERLRVATSTDLT